ncbi:MAG: hypothetical protein AAF662_14765 [Pseudomonadota bacterium]
MSVDLGQMEFDHVEAIANGDIINLVAILDAGLRQFSKCPSATTQNVHAADVNIANNWIAYFKKRLEHFGGSPELYMPKAHPKPKKLPTPPVVNIVENPSIQNLMYSINEMRTELLHSNDAERSNGFRLENMEVTLGPWVAKFEAYVAELESEVDNDGVTWFPDSDLQEPGVNAGSPR